MKCCEKINHSSVRRVKNLLIQKVFVENCFSWQFAICTIQSQLIFKHYPCPTNYLELDIFVLSISTIVCFIVSPILEIKRGDVLKLIFAHCTNKKICLKTI